MTDPLEHRLEVWMQGVGRFDTTDVRDLVRSTSLPARQRSLTLRRRNVARFGAVAAVLIAVVVGVALNAGAPGPKPIPPDPRAFAGDPRLARCAAFGLGDASFVFELAHASDFQRVFPAALRTPELERPDAAFIVVLSAGRGQGIGGGGAPADGTPEASGQGRSICVMLGSGPDAEVNVYSDVDMTGFDPQLVRRLGPDPGVTDAPVPSTPAPSTSTETTPSPGIDWGPLAVVPPSDGSDTARTEGTIHITTDCVVLESSGARTLLVWPADRSAWDTSGSVVRFENFDGATTTIADGDRMVLGGSGGTFAEGGTTFDAWRQSITWVSTSPSDPCGADGYWFVGDAMSSASTIPTSSAPSGPDGVG